MQNQHAPLVLFLFGRPGSGKTTVGVALAKRLGASYFDCDSAYHPTDLEQIRRGLISDESSDAFLERALGHCSEYRRGDILVASQSLFRDSHRIRVRQHLGDRVILVYLDVPVALSVDRVKHRAQPTFYGADEYAREVDLFDGPALYDVAIPNSGTVPEAVDRILQALPTVLQTRPA